MGTPSRISMGWLLPVNERIPLRVSLVSWNTPLLTDWIFRPETLPVKPFARFTDLAWVSSAALILEIEYPSSFGWRATPKAVITTSVPAITNLFTEIEMVLPVPTVVSVGSRPAPDTTSTSPVLARIRNWPLLSADTPVRVPLILTEAPGKASPFSSVTVPDIVRF